MTRVFFIALLLVGASLAVLIPSRPYSFFSLGPDFIPESKISLVFVGDIMLSRDIGKLIKENNTYFPYSFIKERISSFDIAFANLENPVSTKGKNVGSKFSFRAHPDTLIGLKDAGFDIVSFANNHVFDYGPEAFLDTIVHLEKVGIFSSGAGKTKQDAHKATIITKNGISVGYLSYSQFAAPSQRSGENGFAVAGINKEEISNDIKMARESGADIVVTSFHWGEEYKTLHNAYQEEIAHFAIDAGADLVVGHHPHVIQDTEIYKDKFIVYSLGNFIFDQNFSKDTSVGEVLDVEATRNGISKVELKKVHFNKEYQPSFDND